MLDKIKRIFAATDMTEGTPWKKIAIFAIPMLLGNIAQQLYNTVDSIVVGKYIGDNALAAVGSAGPIVTLLIALFVGISTGASILVSQFFGARSREDLSWAVGNCLTLTVICSIIIMIVSMIIVRPLLVLLKTPDSIIDWCVSYILILFIGNIGSAFYNILTGILRGLGDAFSALVYLLVATILNIGLDVLFVAKFNMGVNGVAYATIISQTLSAVLCFIRLKKMSDLFDLSWKHLALRKAYAGRTVRLGLPTGLTQVIFSMAMVVVQSLTNCFGEMFIAANVIIMRVDGFAMLPNYSFGTAMTTYAGQNVGARKMDRVVKGARQGMLLSVGTATVLTILVLVFGKWLMGLFTETPELIDLAYRMMCIIAVGYITMGITQSVSGVMRGAGDTITPMWISMLTTFVIRIPIAYAISFATRTEALPYGDSRCIYISLLVSFLSSAGITMICYLKGRWRRKAQEKMDALEQAA